MKNSAVKYNNYKPKAYQKFKEIIPNFFIGSKNTILNLLTSQSIDILIPLDSLTSEIWDLDYQGEIQYFPIEDYGVLPINVEKRLVSMIVDSLICEKKVALFCISGNGRTGYIASLVISAMYEVTHKHGIIGWLRENHNEEAVESEEQIERVAQEEDLDYWLSQIVIPEWQSYNIYNKKAESFEEMYDRLSREIPPTKPIN